MPSPFRPFRTNRKSPVPSLALSLVLAFAVALAPAALKAEAAEAPPRYSIRLERGAEAGARFLLTAGARISQSESIVEDEEEVQSEGSAEGKVRLVAAATVFGVNSEGGITRAAYEVRSFEGTIDGGPVEAIPPGSVLRTETAEGQTRITLEGGALSPRQLLLLVQVLETAREGQPGDDDLFGSTEPQAVGATWPVNVAPAVTAFSANGTQLTADSVSGVSKLVDKRQVDGVECLRIQGRLDISHMTPPGIDETVFANARMALEYTGNYPVDNVSLPLDGEIRSRLEIRHLLFEPEEEGDLPVYHLTLNESEKSFSIRPIKEEAGKPQDGEASGKSDKAPPGKESA